MIGGALLQATSWSLVVERVLALGGWAREGLTSGAMLLAILLVGWALATLGSAVARAVLRALRFGDGVRRLVGASALGRHDPVALIGWGLHWSVLGATGVLALETLGFRLGASVVERLTDVLPRIVTAALLFVVGALGALLAAGLTRRFLETADVRLAKVLGQVVAAVLLGFSVLMALEQLGFAAQFVMAVGIVAVATAGLGLAMAFGLGCRDLARDFVVEYLRSFEDAETKRSD